MTISQFDDDQEIKSVPSNPSTASAKRIYKDSSSEDVGDGSGSIVKGKEPL